MNKKAIAFFLIFLTGLMQTQEIPQEMESNEAPSVAFEPKKTNEIDPDVHLFGIPLRSPEEVDKIFKKMSDERVDNYTCFYKTRLCCVEVSFYGTRSESKNNEAGEAMGITVMQKGPYEEFNRYGYSQ